MEFDRTGNNTSDSQVPNPHQQIGLNIPKASMFQARDHTASSKSKTRGRGRGKTLKTMFKTMASHLRRGMRSDKEEPLPPRLRGRTAGP